MSDQIVFERIEEQINIIGDIPEETWITLDLVADGKASGIACRGNTIFLGKYEEIEYVITGYDSRLGALRIYLIRDDRNR